MTVLERRLRAVVMRAGAMLAASASLAPVGAAGQTPDPFDGVRRFIREAMAAEGIPSVAVAVAKDGRILWEEGFGWADRERQVPATPHTIYSLASISKPITATGLMILVEEGKVELDAPVNRYLGGVQVTGLAGDADGATVRRLLTHTAGLPLHFQFVYEDGGYALPSIEESIARYGVIVYPPGEVYQYSNMGFGILDQVIARTASWMLTDYMRTEPRSAPLSFPDFMRTRVFLPLGMNRTSIGVAPGLEPYAAVRYDDLDRPIPYYAFDHDGASNAWSSAHDLVRFGMFHLGDRLDDQVPILSEATRGLMQQPDRSAAGAQRGLPWGIGEDRGYRRITHGGGMPGVRTTLNLYPDEDLAVVVLTNMTNGAMGRIAEEAAAAVLPGYARALRAEAAGRAVPAGRGEPGADLLGVWRGELRTWAGAVPMTLRVEPGGAVLFRLGEQLETVVNEPVFEAGRVTGRVAGTIPTPDADRHPHDIILDLRTRGGRLSGQASAHAVTRPEDRVQTSYGHYMLTSWVDLERDGAATTARR